MPEQKLESKSNKDGLTHRWLIGGTAVASTIFFGYLNFRHGPTGMTLKDTLGMLAGATGTFAAKRQWFNGPDFSNNVKIWNAENQQTAKGLAVIACAGLSAGCVAAYLSDSESDNQAKSNEPPSTAAPFATGAVTGNVDVAAIDLGEGSGCEIAPYIIDEEDVNTPEERARKDYSVVMLKKYMKLMGHYDGDTSDSTASKELTYAVDGFQESAGIPTSFPWNINTCLASDFGDGEPGPDLSSVG